MRLLPLAMAVAFLVSAAACSRTAVSDITITLDNLTDTPVGLYINDAWVGTYPAGWSVQEPLGDHGGAPYLVDVRTASGASLIRADVNEAQAASLVDGGPAIAVEHGVACGIIRLVIGELAADEAPAPARSVEPGPCP
ncbi:MAG: hypothetical protein ACLGIJ_10170 [Candidatus Limnocylindria bacterium]